MSTPILIVSLFLVVGVAAPIAVIIWLARSMSKIMDRTIGGRR